MRTVKQTIHKDPDLNMKTIMITTMYLQMTALFLTAVLATPAAADDELPFRGSIQAVETYDVEFPTLFGHGSGAGHGTQLGQFTVTYEYEINIPTATGTGPAHFVAANGDSLFTEVSGKGNPTGDPDISFIVETHIITGGTGRFAGATGSFTVERLISLSTGVTSGSFDGTILH
jgi:hypothetical protein